MSLTKLSVITELAEELSNLRSERNSVQFLKSNAIEIVVDPDGDEIRTKVPVQFILDGLAAQEKALADQLVLHNIEA